MKRSAYAFATLPVFVLFATLAISKPTVRMAILDGPLDYEHAEIQAVLDEDLLKTIKLTNEKGEEKTWFELNQEAKAEFERRLNRNEYKEQVEFFDALNAIAGKQKKDEPFKALQTLGRVAKGMFRYAYSKEFRTQINLLGGYLHGTHVAGIAVDSLSDVRIINYPLAGAPKSLKLSEILEFDAEKFRQGTRKFYSQISEVLRTNNVRVVNLSVEVTPESNVRSMKNRANFFARLALNTVYRTRLLETTRTFGQIMIEEMAVLARENPQAVFVYGAGNSKRNIDQGEIHTAQIKEPNVIQVASINHEGKRSPFSNWSANQIEIAAIGSGVLSALVGGGKVHISGTSMACPKVSNAIARIFSENPLLTPVEAIQTLYDKHSVTDTSLADFTIGGRKLVEVSVETSTLKTLEEEVNLTSSDENELAKLIHSTVEKFSDDVDKIVLKTKTNGKLRGTITFTKNGSNIDVKIEDAPASEASCESAAAG